jgi:hypothetical protein
VAGVVLFLAAAYFTGLQDLFGVPVRAVALGTGALSLVGPAIESLVLWVRAQRKKLSDLDERLESYVTEPDYETKLGFLHLVDHDMDRALELLAGDYPVAVFIDDLDRCDPDVVNKVILAINQFLSLPHRNTIFFLGMDMDVVASSLEEVRGAVVSQKNLQVDSNQSFGWEFMDKFVQVPFFIPRLDPLLSREFMERILVGRKEQVTIMPAQRGRYEGDLPETADAVNLREIAESESVEHLAEEGARELEKVRSPEKRRLVQEVISRRATELLRDPQGEEIQRLVEIAIREIDLNPRAMKRYLNLVRLLRNVQLARGLRLGGDVDRKLVLRAAHLLITWPRVVRWLQESACYETEIEGLPPLLQNLMELVDATSDAEGWTERLTKQLGGRVAALAGDPELYRFLKRIQASSPGLAEIYWARMF